MNSERLPHAWEEIVFSAADGWVWASWPGSAVTAKLGRYESVLAMMQDFIDQSALADDLTKRQAIKRLAG